MTGTLTSGAGIALNGNNGNAPNTPGRLSITGWADGAGDLILHDGRVRLNATSATAAVGSRVLLSRNIVSSGLSSVTNINGSAATVNTNNFTNKAFDFVSSEHTVDVADGTLTFTSAAAAHPLQVTSTHPGGTALTKTGTGTWVWEHAVQIGFAGTNRIENGAWHMAPTSGWPTRRIWRSPGGVFDLQTFSETVAAIELSGGTVAGSGTATLFGTGFDARSGRVQARLAGGMGLTKTTDGVVQVDGLNSYTGPTSVADGTLLVNGTHTGGGAYSVAAGATLGGNGTIASPVMVQGTIAPGHGLGTLNVTSNVTLAAGAHLAVKLSGTAADKLVAANLDISGGASLDVTLLAPAVGTGWLVAEYSGSLSGQFGVATAGYTVDYTMPGKIFLLQNAALAGDYNGNGTVDAADYVVWRDNLGTTSFLSNDLIGGVIGPDQYNQWRGNFGRSNLPPSRAAGLAVPEPGRWIFALLSLLGELALVPSLRLRRQRATCRGRDARCKVSGFRSLFPRDAAPAWIA